MTLTKAELILTFNQIAQDAVHFDQMLLALARAGEPYQLQLYRVQDHWIFKTPGGGKMRYDTVQFEEAAATFLIALVTEVRLETEHKRQDDFEL